jgi:membrane associated rhomboid family serine protease
MDKMQFNAARVVHKKEYYRLLSHAFVHANWTHLLVNMMVLFFFGPAIESYFGYFFGNKSIAYFLLLYVGGILASNLWAIYKHKNDYYYNAVGASGAISAVLFAFIFINPLEKLYFYFVIPIPGILFGVGYLFYSYQMGKKGHDNVAHEAHILGAVFGFLFPALFKPSLIGEFISKLFSFL